jgi:S-adenosylmethionine:tRNA-ribosyltransferase-isomerase (queuine synthetase)
MASATAAHITERLVDQDRYQTVYAPPAGSAGTHGRLALHRPTADKVGRARHRNRQVELVVGLDTFRPIAV